ncbi:MAG TPA: epimerase, partial [Nitrospirota bacterium]|nr:epimerase [Nitrospirota bacterium]
RPGFIKPLKGQKNAHTISRIAGMLYPAMNILVPKYICTMEEVAKAMILAVKAGYPKQVLENSDIVRLGGTETGTANKSIK